MLIKERSEVLPTPLTTTVPREYVHRAALSEVFLTGWHRNGPDSFTVTAQWPRSHCFYSSEHGLYDPLMLCETARQTFPLLAHAAYDMPFGYQLSWRDLRYEVDPSGLHIKGTPAEVELRVSCSDIRYLRSLPASIRMHIELVRDGVPFAAVETEFGCHSPEVYRRLRAGRGDAAGMFLAAPVPTAPLPPGLVGRGRDQDVVLSPSGELGRWRLRVDTAHPVLFDHPVDHVPGMVMLESVRQAAHALNPSRGAALPLFMDVRFNRYVEFDSPCWIEAEALPGESAPGRHRLRVDALQGEASAFSAVAEMAVVSAF